VRDVEDRGKGKVRMEEKDVFNYPADLLLQAT
jgi:hypothetical protein